MDKAFCNPDIWGGIECTINRVGNDFFDQLSYSGHYDREHDLENLISLGITKMRYPILWERHEPAKGEPIDWGWTRKQLNFLREKNVSVIAGLVHHGSGPAFTSLLDPDFPDQLASYARKVAEEFPWITDYTPINEPLTTSRFSGLYGLWYPHHHKDKSFLQMLINELKGTVLAMREIRKVNPLARLIQTEDLGKTYSTAPLNKQAEFENHRRWLTMDLLCGRVDNKHPLWKYFLKNGITAVDLEFFRENTCVPDVLGFNHYLTSERYLDHRTHLYPAHTHGGNGLQTYADVEAVRVEVGVPSGLQVLLQEAWSRYRLPIAVTEVHLHCHREEQLRWFRTVYDTCSELRAKGIDILAITSWAMLGSFGWNKLLTKPGGEYEPGAFDVRSGVPRRTALANFIASVCKEKKAAHPLVNEKGWWQRSSRWIYSSSLPPRQLPSTRLAPILIIGKNGTLGRAFSKICEDRMLPYRLISRQDCDISRPEEVEMMLEQYKPWAVVNASGFVRVDDAEHEGEACLRDNTYGPHILAAACERRDVRVINFSSDLVFDGGKTEPYLECDPVNPLNAYGRSKALAESLILRDAPSALIARTSAFFGPWDEYNFVYHTRRSLNTYEPIRLPQDVLVSPTYLPHLVHAALDLLVDGEKGIWHLANEGAITWYDWGVRIADQFELDSSLIEPVSSEVMGYRARRPKYSVLGSSRGHQLPTLEKAMLEYVKEHAAEKRKVA